MSDALVQLHQRLADDGIIPRLLDTNDDGALRDLVWCGADDVMFRVISDANAWSPIFHVAFKLPLGLAINHSKNRGLMYRSGTGGFGANLVWWSTVANRTVWISPGMQGASAEDIIAFTRQSFDQLQRRAAPVEGEPPAWAYRAHNRFFTTWPS